MHRKRRVNLQGGVGVKLMILVSVLVLGGEGRGFGAKGYEGR